VAADGVEHLAQIGLADRAGQQSPGSSSFRWSLPTPHA
jgi:hypothetical protein